MIEPLKTVIVITVGFLIVYLLTEFQWALYVSLAVGIFGLLSNFIAEKINLIWIKVMLVPSLIVPNILLSLIYFLLLVPLAYLSKLFSPSIQLKLKNIHNSMFIDSKGDYDKDYFNKMW